MFTGIITDIGKVIEPGAKFVIRTAYDTEKIALGASISCNGCCLTVVSIKENLLEFDLSPETLEKTNLSGLKAGEDINLEQALKVGDELGGHIVSGHIDGISEVVAIKASTENKQIKFKFPLSFGKYIVPKGSVTLNGVSLTVNTVENDIFEVNIIPHTLLKTNLKDLKVGSNVNFEIDTIARYLEKLIQK